MTTPTSTPTTTLELAGRASVLARRDVRVRQLQLESRTVEGQSQLVLEWLKSYSSPNTREAYSRDFRYFRWFMRDALGIWNLGEVTREDANDYKASLDEDANEQGRKLSSATKHRRLASVASFFDYCLQENLLAYNPFSNVKRPKVSKFSPRSSLSKAEAIRLLELVEDQPARTRALVAFTLLAGLRVTEALSVTASSFAHKDGHIVVQIQRKGDKPDEVPLSPMALRLCAEALEASKLDGLPLIRTVSGGIMLRQQASKDVARLGRLAGLPFVLVPHSLRHTAGTLADEAGAPLERVQTFLGHENTETTLRYLHSRKRLDNSASYTLSSYLSDSMPARTTPTDTRTTTPTD